VIYGLIYLFYDPNPDDPLNREAADLYRNDRAQVRSYIVVVVVLIVFIIANLFFFLLSLFSLSVPLLLFLCPLTHV
jgi:hypothetical protein